MWVSNGIQGERQESPLRQSRMSWSRKNIDTKKKAKRICENYAIDDDRIIFADSRVDQRFLRSFDGRARGMFVEKRSWREAC